MRADGVAEDKIDRFVTRMLQALGVYRNKAQVEVGQIGIDLREQLGQNGDKLQADLHTQHGETNQMLADLRSAQQEAGRGIADIKKLWGELEQWRSRIEATLISLSEFRKLSTEDRRQIRDAVAQQDARHERQIGELIAQFDTFIRRITEIERHLEIAGSHEAGN